MIRAIYFLLLLSRLFAIDAKAQGVVFENGLTWSQIKAKAKAEHKYIFIDFMATWCKPCKEMDNQVYKLDSVGKVVNEQCICVKVQGDKKANDNEEIKYWYKDAEALLKEYAVDAFPTYLFLSPEGNAVHKDIGYKWAGEFLDIVRNVNKPSKQYFTLLERYKDGKCSYLDMPYLVTMLNKFKQKELEKRVAHDYIYNYLMELGEPDLYKEENIRFIAAHTSSTDEAFALFYPDGRKVDAVIKGQSDQLVSYIISKEEIQPYILKDGNYRQPIIQRPDWKGMQKSISKKYNALLVEKQILTEQMNWYKVSRPDSVRLATATISYFAKFGDYTDKWGRFGINNSMWYSVFQITNHKVLLLKAAAIQRKSLDNSQEPLDAGYIDTYANLLYRGGKTEEALLWEQRAVDIDSTSAVKANNKPNPEFQQTLDKMMAGEPTWKVK